MKILTSAHMYFLQEPINGIPQFWITPILPCLVTLIGLLTLLIKNIMIIGLMSMVILRGESSKAFQFLLKILLLSTNMTSGLLLLTLLSCILTLVGSTRKPLRKQSTRPLNGLLLPPDTTCKHFKSRLPAFIIPRSSEEVTTDTIFSDTSAVDSGVTMAQISVTLVTDVYPMKSTKLFVYILEEGKMWSLFLMLLCHHKCKWSTNALEPSRGQGLRLL